MSRANQVGRYIVDDVAREEPLGRVLRSRMPRLERGVLIREFSPAPGTDAGLRDRLRRAFDAECRCLAQVRDPRVPEPLEADDTDGGAYVVFPRPESEGFEPLGSLRGLSAPAWIALAGEIARALAALAAAGVTLRRFRPEDVWTRAPAEVRVLPLDFGSLALAAGAPDLAGPAGAASHLAPECARGEPGAESAAVFSLAAWLYERLAPGAPPAAKTAREGRRPEGLFALNPAVPASVDDALQAALEPDAAARTTSLARLAAALPQPPTAPGVAAPAGPPAAPVERPAELPPALRFAAWLVGLTLLAGASGWLLAGLFPPR